MQLLLSLLAVFAASLIKGITGFGFALISLPILMLWHPAKTLIPILMMCNLVASFIIILQKKSMPLVDSNARHLIGYGAATTLLGVALLTNISEEKLSIFIGIFFIILSLISLLKPDEDELRPRKRWTFKVVGILCGLLTGSISVSGPPLALFLHSQKFRNDEFREIFAWFSVITAVIAMAGYAFAGLLTLKVWEFTLLFLPILFAGTYVGKRLNARMPHRLFSKLSIILCLIASILLLKDVL